MRRLFSIALLALLLANFAGSYIYFSVRAIQIKRDMRALLAILPVEELDVIILTKEEFRKARVDQHEIKVEGKMFDIARTRSEDGLVYVYGVYDEDEDSLLSFLNAALRNLQADSAQTPPSFSLFSVLQYLPESFDFDFKMSLEKSLSQTSYLRSWCDFINPIDSPPPKSVLAVPGFWSQLQV